MNHLNLFDGLTLEEKRTSIVGLLRSYKLFHKRNYHSAERHLDYVFSLIGFGDEGVHELINESLQVRNYERAEDYLFDFLIDCIEKFSPQSDAE